MGRRPTINAFVILIAIPIIINILVQVPSISFPPLYGTNKEWFQFFGSYFGGAVGALVAVYIANIQVESAKEDFDKKLSIEKKQRLYEEEKQNQFLKRENRMFINDEWKWTDWNIENHPEIYKAKIIYTFDYRQRELLLKKDKKNITTFLKVALLGNEKYVTDCTINICVKNFQPELKVNPIHPQQDPTFEENKLELFIPIITTEELLFIPIVNCYLKPEEFNKYYEHKIYDVEKFEITYLTPINERMKYRSNFNEGKEEHIVINDDGTESIILQSKQQDISWKIPGVKIVE